MQEMVDKRKKKREPTNTKHIHSFTIVNEHRAFFKKANQRLSVSGKYFRKNQRAPLRPLVS